MRNLSLGAVLALVFVASCSDETTVYRDQLEDDVAVEENATTLDNSISFDDAGVLDIFDEQRLSGKSSKADEQAGDYPLTLVAQISAPSYTGATNLGATHIDIDGDYAYVSYNTVEDGYAGGLDIINVSDPNNPRLTGRLYYTNADMNAIAYDDGYIYAVGGFDSEKSTRSEFNSLVAKIAVSGGRFNLGAGITYGFQEGFNATDVKVSGDRVLVTSGGDGLLRAYNKSDLTILDDVPYADLRSVALNNDKIAILDASTGVKIMNADFGVTQEINISSDFGNFAKRTLDYTDDMIVVSEGSKGAGVYDANSGSLLKYLPILINPEGVAEQNIVTNAVASNEGVILMANGGAGLCLSEDQGTDPDLVGIIELSGSINYVASKGDYIFAASGKSGVQVIKLNRPSTSLVEECSSSPTYSGSSSLTVNSGQDLAYRGSKRFNSITNSGELLLCGSWTVRNAVDINSNALMEMNGTLVVGRNNRRRDVTVDEGATLRIEGNLIIYGDLILNDGATIEFLGGTSSANIFGQVVRNGNTTVTGTFDDVRNKF
ncbi:hypothetical protein [Maribacter sp. 2307UL18-2]|uniref:hypothetical protein n=1 Tax=Maribacter sp. 2307UL18-2 TaxID=3386274 RepID=UPI0039BCA2A7